MYIRVFKLPKTGLAGMGQLGTEDEDPQEAVVKYFKEIYIILYSELFVFSVWLDSFKHN